MVTVGLTGLAIAVLGIAFHSGAILALGAFVVLTVCVVQMGQE